MFLKFIEVFLEHQNQGIDTTILKAIREEARDAGQHVYLQALKVNPAPIIV